MIMTIGRKLSVGLGVILFMVLIMGGVFLWATKQVQEAVVKNQGVREINGLMTARIVDHYKWVDGLSAGVSFKGSRLPASSTLQNANLENGWRHSSRTPRRLPLLLRPWRSLIKNSTEQRTEYSLIIKPAEKKTPTLFSSAKPYPLSPLSRNTSPG